MVSVGGRPPSPLVRGLGLPRDVLAKAEPIPPWYGAEGRYVGTGMPFGWTAVGGMGGGSTGG